MDQQRVLAWHHFDNAAHNALAPHPFRSDGEKGHGVAAGSGAVQTTHQPADPRGEAEAIARQHTFLILLPLGQIAAGLWELARTPNARQYLDNAKWNAHHLRQPGRFHLGCILVVLAQIAGGLRADASGASADACFHEAARQANAAGPDIPAKALRALYYICLGSLWEVGDASARQYLENACWNAHRFQQEGTVSRYGAVRTVLAQLAGALKTDISPDQPTA
ncbi:MAG: hypothetical protein KDA49_15105 [Rhodospirillaceae bacterium]|nr:hypothetical protein [Rhodospirillaceae bacterium]MCA8933802.1 hypothetical protein [Rhodospirillaceae bacterium]